LQSNCFPFGWFEDWSRCTRWSSGFTGYLAPQARRYPAKEAYNPEEPAAEEKENVASAEEKEWRAQWEMKQQMKATRLSSHQRRVQHRRQHLQQHKKHRKKAARAHHRETKAPEQLPLHPPRAEGKQVQQQKKILKKANKEWPAKAGGRIYIVKKKGVAQAAMMAAKKKKASAKKQSARIAVKKKKLETHKEETEDAKEQLLDDMAQATSDRAEENANYIAAKDDDVKAAGLLEYAIAAISSWALFCRASHSEAAVWHSVCKVARYFSSASGF